MNFALSEYCISSNKALSQIIPVILIIPSILIILCSEKVVFSNKEGYVRKYGIHLMLIYSTSTTYSPYFQIFALSELYVNKRGIYLCLIFGILCSIYKQTGCNKRTGWSKNFI